MPGARITAGERVTLRTLEKEDLPFLQRAYANPELRYPLGTPLKNLDQLETWNEDEGADQFLVCLDGDETTKDSTETDTRSIGAVFVEDASWRRPELVYWLVPDAQGEGYGTEAVSLVIDYIFRVYDTPAVSAGAYAFNDASQGLLESLGFEKEGRLLDILPALKGEDSSVGGSATDPRGQLAGSCALLWDVREGVVSPTNRGRPTRIARAVPSA